MFCALDQRSERTGESLQRQDGSCKPPFREVAVRSSDVLRRVDGADHLILAHLASNACSSQNTLLGHVFSVKQLDGRKPLPAQGRSGREALCCPPRPGDLWRAVHTPQDHAHPAALLGKTLQRAEKQKPPFFLQSIICQEALSICQPYFRFKSTAL